MAKKKEIARRESQYEGFSREKNMGNEKKEGVSLYSSDALGTLSDPQHLPGESMRGVPPSYHHNQNDDLEDLMTSIHQLVHPFSSTLSEVENQSPSNTHPSGDLHSYRQDASQSCIQSQNPLLRKETYNRNFNSVDCMHNAEKIIDLDKVYVEMEGPSLAAVTPSCHPHASVMDSCQNERNGFFDLWKEAGWEMGDSDKKEHLSYVKNIQNMSIKKREVEHFAPPFMKEEGPKNQGDQVSSAHDNHVAAKERDEKKETNQQDRGVNTLSSFVRAVQEVYQAKKKPIPHPEHIFSEGSKSLDSFLKDLLRPHLEQWIDRHPEILQKAISSTMYDVVKNISEKQIDIWMNECLASIVKERIDHQLEKLMKEVQDKI